MNKKQHIPPAEEQPDENFATTESTAAEDYQQFISVAENGRKYRTTFTTKFANRKKWERPNPEEIKSFIPGTVEKILVKVGQEVKQEDELMYYMAMKMRNVIRAPYDGKVTSIQVKEGDRLRKGAVMLVIKEKQLSLKDQKKLEKEQKEYEKKVERKNKIKK